MAAAVGDRAAEVASALASVRGSSGWIFTDGKAGNETQSRGVFEALGLVSTLKAIDPGRMQRFFSPYARVSKRERFGEPGSRFAPPWPDFAVAIGRLTTPYIRTLRRFAGRRTYTIILQDPKVSLNTADIFWMPEHDQRRGPNVITTLTAPHGFSRARIAALKAASPPPAFAALPRPWIAVVLGGDNGDYRYTEADEARLAAGLIAVQKLGGSLLVTPSRRTQPRLLAAVRAVVAAGQTGYVWDGGGDNPYPAMIAHADRFIVTADSVNMCGEPAATGRPIHVFFPSGGSAKFARYHAALARHGATRPLEVGSGTLDNWSYPPLFAAEAIAAEIALRWQRRNRMLGGDAGNRQSENRG